MEMSACHSLVPIRRVQRVAGCHALQEPRGTNSWCLSLNWFSVISSSLGDMPCGGITGFMVKKKPKGLQLKYSIPQLPFSELHVRPWKSCHQALVSNERTGSQGYSFSIVSFPLVLPAILQPCHNFRMRYPQMLRQWPEELGYMILLSTCFSWWVDTLHS